MRGRRGLGLIGTAVVVGGAAHMGAKSAQKSQAAVDQEAAQNAQITDLQAQQAAAAAPPPAAAPAAPAEPDYVAELEQLNQLKSQGITTNEEFEAKKKQIIE